MSQIKNTVHLLETLKVEKDDLTKAKAFGFAAKTLELIKKSVGEQSEQYRLMKTLFYDQTAAHLEYTYYPVDTLIVMRVKMGGQFDSIIDSCIAFIGVYGLYKPPYEKKNIFGDLDNAMLWTLVGFIVTTSFLAGVVVTNYGLSKFFDPNATGDKVRTESSEALKKDTLRLGLPSRNHNTIKAN